MNVLRSKYMKMIYLASIAVLPLTVSAQTDKLQRELGKCLAINDINVRVACYDNLARPLFNNPEASQTPVAKNIESATPAKVAEVLAAGNKTESAAKITAPTSTETENSKIEKFGQQQAKLESNSQGEEALVDKVSVLKELQPNKLQITLANGQVWQQTIGKAFFIRMNDTVRITQSSWGSSFHLEIVGRPGFIQVSRLR